MISPAILKKYGLTEDRLRSIFTAQRPAGENPRDQKPAFVPTDTPESALNPVSPINEFPKNPEDWQIREFFEQEIRSHLDEGIQRSMSSYRLYQAADMALDGTLVSQLQLPLGMLAQGYIDLSSCHKEIERLSPSVASELFQFDEQKRPIKFLAPKLTEISHNLVKSFITRRIAAVTTPIRQRFPLCKYSAFDTSLVGQLKSDMMTQYFEQMSDSFGYRPALEQTGRDASMYGHQVEFVRSPWEKRMTKLQRRRKPNGTEGVGPESSDWEEYDAVEKEGLDFVAPHPSRVFWDHIEPLRKINTDTGPEYIGYWDVARIGGLRREKKFWNREAIEWDTGLWELMSQNQSYFRFYYREAIAVAESNNGKLIGLRNDRQNNIGRWYQAIDDQPTTIAYYFRKLNPKQWGIAKYDGDVWLRFIVAGNSTVIWADVCGSTPAAYCGYNESDQRDVSSSFAHDCMQFQDQVTNLLTQLLDIQHQGLTRIYALNKDGMDEPSIKSVEDALKNRNYQQAEAIIIKFSAEALRDMGVDARTQYAERLKAIEVSTTEKTTEIFRSIMNLLALAERQLFFSPQELGQVAPREITATEANMVNNTTLGIRDFHAIGIEEFLDAKKRIVYESAIAFGSDQVVLPVVNTYSRATVEAAGFTIIGIDSEENVETAKTGRFTLSGSLHDLTHNYVFTTRDGTERPPSKEVAQSIVQLMQIIGQNPSIGQAVTVGQGVDLLQAVTRTLGIPVKLRLPQGVDADSPLSGNPQEQFQQFAQGVQQAIQALATQLQQTQQGQQALSQSMQVLAETVQKLATKRGTIGPGFPRGTGAPPMQVQQADAPFLSEMPQ